MSGGLFLQQILMQHLVGFVVPHIELLFWISGFHVFFSQGKQKNRMMRGKLGESCRVLHRSILLDW